MHTVSITRRVEFDMGHRVPHHGGKCRYLHGHRYRLEATVDGPINPPLGKANDGMIVDFGLLKTVLHNEIIEVYDHRFAVHKDDTLCEVLLLQDSWGAIPLDYVPTAENLVGAFAASLERALKCSDVRLSLTKLRLYETPNCWADWSLHEQLSHTH